MTVDRRSRSTVIAARKAPQQARSKQLVASILEAAARILEEESASFTTNHIAQRAGVSIGSLYQYYPGADAILATLIENHVADERAAAEAILEGAQGLSPDVVRDLLVAFVGAHADAPRLTSRLHAMAPAFGLQDRLASARDAQAERIAEVLGLPTADVRMSVMAVEGVVLATLAGEPAMLKTDAFLEKLHAMVAAVLMRHPDGVPEEVSSA